MRRIVFFIAGIFLLLLLFSAFTLFLPAKVAVSKSITISVPRSEVIAQIDNFNNWKKWCPAFRDCDVMVTITGSKNRSAELRDKFGRRIVFRMLSVSDSSVAIALYIKGKSVTTYQFVLSAVGIGSTDVTWNALTNLGWYPWKKLQGIILDKVTGEQYISALKSLKATAESHEATTSPE